MTQPDPAAQRGWLKDVLDENRRTLDSWPEWKRRLYMTDPAAQQYKTYLCSYRFKGEQYQFEIRATSLSEAVDRLDCLRGNATVDGERMLTIRCGWTERLRQWLTT